MHIFLAEGFEEVEALLLVDIIRRAGLEIKIVSVTGERLVKSSHDVTVLADTLIEEENLEGSQMLILPGGMPGSTNLSKSASLCEAIKSHYDKGGLLSAICAGPMVFGKLGLLKGKSVTCYPGFEVHLEGACYTGKLIEEDGNIITGKGPAAAFPLGLAIVERVGGKDLADKVKEGMLYPELIG